MTLLEPADNAVDVLLPPSFSFIPHTRGDADERFRISRRIGTDQFTVIHDDLVAASMPLTEIDVTPDVAWEYSTTYEWQVTVYSDLINVASPVHSFTTAPAPPLPAILQVPIDGAVNMSITPLLRWRPDLAGSLPSGYVIYFGEDEDNLTPYIYDGSMAGPTFAWTPPDELAGYTVYYWQIVPENMSGPAENCPVRSFTTLRLVPNAATYIDPANNAPEQAPNLTFNWNAPVDGYPHHGYRIYLDLNNPPQTIVAELDADQTSWTASPNLVFGRTYFWKVVPFNDQGEANNPSVWSFTTTYGRPHFAVSPSPANFAVNIPIDTSFSWVQAPNGGVALGYKIHFGTASRPPYLTTVTGLNWTPDFDLESGTQYYWSIVPYNQYGDALGSSVWTFTTTPDPPDHAIAVAPLDGSFDIPLTQVLSWQPAPTGGVPNQYRLYFGTEDIFVAANSVLLPATQTTWSPAATMELLYSTEYFWKVVPINNISGEPIEECPVWSFTTIPPPPIFSVNASSYIFGKTAIGESAPPCTLVVTNLGVRDLVIRSITIRGSGLANYSFDDTGFDYTIASGDSSFILVNFTPTSTGMKNATVDFMHNAEGQMGRVILRGEGAYLNPVRNLLVMQQDETSLSLT